MTGDAHTPALSLELGRPSEPPAAPAPQPAAASPCPLLHPPLPPPQPGRAAKPPAASGAYCSAVTGQGCRSTGPGGWRGRGRGGASRGNVSQQRLPGSGLPALRPPAPRPPPPGPRACGSPNANPTHGSPRLSSQDVILAGRACRRFCGLMMDRVRPPPEKEFWSLLSQPSA